MSLDTIPYATPADADQAVHALRTLATAKEAVAHAEEALLRAKTHAEHGPNGATETDEDRLVAYAKASLALTDAKSAYGRAKHDALRLGQRLR